MDLCQSEGADREMRIWGGASDGVENPSALLVELLEIILSFSVRSFSLFLQNSSCKLNLMLKITSPYLSALFQRLSCTRVQCQLPPDCEILLVASSPLGNSIFIR